MMKPLLFAVLLPCLFASTSQAELSLDFESGAVWTGTNDVRIPADTGTLFSLASDLNAEPAVFFRGRATWHMGTRHDFSVLAAPLRTESEGAFATPVNFAGTTFAANTPTTARYRFDSYRLTYRYNFITTDTLTFGMGLTGKIRDASIQVHQGGLSARDANLGFVPLINFRLDWRFAPRFSLLLEGDALVGPNGRAEDVLAAVQYHATKNIALRLGYRILEGGVDSDSTYTSALFHYLSAGITYRF
jgi:opacity protein-like surface antigen